MTDAQNKVLGKVEIKVAANVGAMAKRERALKVLTDQKLPLASAKGNTNDTLVIKGVPKGDTITFSGGGTGEVNEVLNGKDVFLSRDDHVRRSIQQV